MDNHVLHPLEAPHCLARWRRQKHNRKLKARIAELTQQAAEYAAQLADANWEYHCDTAVRQLSSRNTWRLFGALIKPTQTRTETQKHLQHTVHSFHGKTTQRARKLRNQYLCTTQDHRGPAYPYAGTRNVELDKPFQLQDLRVALAKIKRGTAPGRDKKQSNYSLTCQTRPTIPFWITSNQSGSGMRHSPATGRPLCSLSFPQPVKPSTRTTSTPHLSPREQAN